MGVRESLLNTITSVADSDFVRIVTSAGASSKATLQNVIKSFESGLGSKTSLTDSDYIRIVGSDNNLYKQSVSDVEKRTIEDYTTSLNGRTQSIKTAIERTSLYCHSPSYIDNTTTIYAYVKAQYNSGKTNGEILEVGCADAPTSSAYRVLWFGVSSDATADITLFAWPNNSPSGGIYMTRFHAVSGSALDPWVHLPTRAEVDAINNKIRRLDWGSSWTINVDVNKPFIAFTPDALFVGNRWGTSIAFQNIGGGAGRLTATVNSDNTVTITATSATFVTIVTI